MPQRVELARCEVSMRGMRPLVELEINYVVAPHVERNDEIFDRVQEDLEKALNEYPIKALKRLRDWPFDLDAQCYLAGRPIPVRMQFPQST